MSLIRTWIDFILHIQDRLKDIVNTYHGATYGILAAIIFAETGLIILPFLPGDSLLLAAGAISADPSYGLNIYVLLGVTFAAAFIGNMVNYQAGRMLGMSVFEKKIPFIKKHHLEETHTFFNKYGGRAILLSRFMPIIRTIAPFVAGVGRMGYGEFMLYNALGGALWVGICLGAGYQFGNIPFVKKNFEIIIIGVILVSLIPALYTAFRSRSKQSTDSAT